MSGIKKPEGPNEEEYSKLLEIIKKQHPMASAEYWNGLALLSWCYIEDSRTTDEDQRAINEIEENAIEAIKNYFNM